MAIVNSAFPLAGIGAYGVARPDGRTLVVNSDGVISRLDPNLPIYVPPVPPIGVGGVPIASNTVYGVLRPDDVTVKITADGILYLATSAVPAPFPPASIPPIPVGVPLATATSMGVVAVDGISIRLDGSGSLNTSLFDPTLGGVTANSYVTVEDARLLLAALPPSPGITAWLSFTLAQQEQTLVAATAVLDSLSWVGRKCSCNQRLEHPRLMKVGRCCNDCSSINSEVKLATVYLAAFLGEQGGFAGIQETGGANAVAALEPFDEVTIGPIRVKMKNDSYGDQFATNLGQIPPFVADLIRPYLNPFGAAEGYLGRESLAKAWGTYIGGPAYTGSMYLRGNMVYPRTGGWASNGRGRRY
jgi:hypothetical protein